MLLKYKNLTFSFIKDCAQLNNFRVDCSWTFGKVVVLVENLSKMTIKRPGPIHINLAFEEPLHPCEFDQKKVFDGWQIDGFLKNQVTSRKDEVIKVF